MDTITAKDLLLFQPDYPNQAPTDEYYLRVANRLIDCWDNGAVMQHVSAEQRKRCVIGLVCYLQDIVADSGIWRTFITECYRMYKHPVPFYEADDEYIDSELNRIDVQFILWYTLEFSDNNEHGLNPFNEELLALADALWKILDSVYDDAPIPVEYQMIFDLEMNDTEDIQHIYDLGYWLFWHSYFLRPAFSTAFSDLQLQAHEIVTKHNEQDAKDKLDELNRDAMMRYPTGPLAMFVREWMYLIIDGKIPTHHKKSSQPAPVHKYYKQLTHANGGKPMRIIGSYDELQDFLHSSMGWGDGKEEILPDLKGASNFVLYATPERGMLIASDVAQYINIKGNTLYNKDEAKRNAHRLIEEKGCCPIDLVTYLFSNNLVPDAAFHGENSEIVKRDWDFIARCYLLEFYRAD